MDNPKEVRFDKYCHLCVDFEAKSSEDKDGAKCDRCLTEGMRDGTEIPAEFRLKLGDFSAAAKAFSDKLKAMRKSGLGMRDAASEMRLNKSVARPIQHPKDTKN